MKEQNTKFSIIMPAYNAEKTILESIVSVQNQEYKDWELLVVDDKSVDKTASVVAIAAKNDSRIKLLTLDQNSGVASARNRAMEIAKGKYIAFLDSDDTWTRNKLTLQYEAFRAGAKIVFGSYRRVFNDNTYQIVKARPLISEKIFKFYNPIGNLTGAFDRTIGIVPQNQIRHEDYLMWYELVCRSKNAVGINSILGNYRVSTTSLSANKLKAAKWHWDVLTKGMNLSSGKAAIGFMVYTLNTVSIRMQKKMPLKEDSGIQPQ